MAISPSHLNRLLTQVAAARVVAIGLLPMDPVPGLQDKQSVSPAGLSGGTGRGCAPRSSQPGEECSGRVLTCGHHCHLPLLHSKPTSAVPGSG